MRKRLEKAQHRLCNAEIVRFERKKSLQPTLTARWQIRSSTARRVPLSAARFDTASLEGARMSRAPTSDCEPRSSSTAAESNLDHVGQPGRGAGDDGDGSAGTRQAAPSSSHAVDGGHVYHTWTAPAHQYVTSMIHGVRDVKRHPRRCDTEILGEGGNKRLHYSS